MNFAGNLMQTIKFTFLSSLRDITRVDEIILPIENNSTVNSVLEKLIIKFGKEFENRIYNSSEGINSYVLIALNGKDISIYNGLKTEIKNGDELFLLPIIAGG